MKFLSHVWSIARGSVGGITYLSGRNNALVARQRTAPVQPNTNAQVQMRSAWAGAEALWRNTTDIIRQQWQLYADLVVYQGPTGPYTLTGRQRFLGTLALIAYINTRFAETIGFSADVPVAPGWFLTSRHKLAAPGAPGTGFSLSIANDEAVDSVILVNVSQVVPATRNFWKGPWDDAKTLVFDIAASTTGAHDIIGLIDGEKYFVRARAVGDLADHRIGAEVILSGIAEVTAV